MRTTLNLDQFFFSFHWQMKTSFSLTIMGSYTCENNCGSQWRRKTTLMDLPDLASNGSPLFANLFLFGWALSKTSTYCMLTIWLRCENYSLRGEFPLLHRLLRDMFTYTHCFGYPELILPLKTSFPITLFSFLETNVCWNQSSYAMNVLLISLIFLRR